MLLGYRYVSSRQLRTCYLKSLLLLSAVSGCEQTQQGSPLFDHRVRNREQPRRNGKPERLGGLEIDDEVEFGWL